MLIVGLGNPGAKYDGTPHNVGFDVVDELASRCGVTFKEQARFRAWLAEGVVGGQRVMLMKPLTFMNASGESVGAWLRYYKQLPEELLVVYDDADLPPGRLRIRGSGRSGGHNGLASVIAHVGTDQFARIRIGIGRGGARSKGMIAHVLGALPPEAREQVGEQVKRAADAVAVMLEAGLEQAMNRFNRAEPTAEAPGEQEKKN